MKTGLLSVLLLWISAGVGYSQQESEHRFPRFEMQDLQGNLHSSAHWNEASAVVLAWTGIDCPMAQVYAPKLERIAGEYADENVIFLMIDSNFQDSEAELLRFSRERGLSIPVIMDSHGEIAQSLNVQRTTEILVYAAPGVLVYRGALDDQYAFRSGTGTAGSVQKIRPTRHYLREALDAVLKKQIPLTTRTKPWGCAITYSDHDLEALVSAETEAVTYYEDIEPILRTNCQECHRPQGGAPFALLDYEEVEGWAAMVEEVVTEKRMPPWNADPAIGQFMNARGLTPKEIQLIKAWVRQGAPSGDPQNALPPADWPTGWDFEPDLVIPLPERTVPAEGLLRYDYVRIPTGFTEDRWVVAAQVISTAPEVVHHLLTLLEEDEDVAVATERPWKPKFDEMDLVRQIPRRDRGKFMRKLQPYTYDLMQGGGGGIGGFFIPALPGNKPMYLPPGQAKLLPAGATLIFQVHYTPNGKEQVSQSSLALQFMEGPPEYAVDTGTVTSVAIEIPPHEGRHEMRAQYRFPRGAHVLALAPHMHLRGKSATMTAVYPDGVEEVLLSVPTYDFNWQDFYRFVKPKYFPTGTLLQLDAVFDNSWDNPLNPDPEQTVYFGLQTDDEMFIGYFEAVWDQN